MKNSVLGNKLITLIKYLYRNSDKGHAEYFLGNEKIIFLFSPESIYELFTSKSKNFNRGISFNNMKIPFGKGILVSDNPDHVKDKKIMSPAFHKNKIDKSCSEVYNISKTFLKKYDKETIDILEISQKFTFDSVSQCFFGQKFPEDYLRVINASHDKVGNVETASLTKDDFKDFNDIKKFFADFSEKNKKDNLIKLMSDSGMSKENIADQMITVLSAGFETTSNLITWSLFYLSENQKVLEDLRKENNFWIKENRPPSLEEIQNSKMIRKIIKETLRVKPPGYWTTRVAKLQTSIGNIVVEKNDNILVSQYISHFNEKYFENPKEWNPYRWTEDFEKELPKGVYFPFVYGESKCIGDQFGIMMASIFILLFINKYNFNKVGNFPKEGYMISLFPTGNTKMEISSML